MADTCGIAQDGHTGRPARHQSHRREAVAGRTAIFGEQYAHNIADVDQPTRSLENRWIIDGDWKLIVPDPRNRPNAQVELYHVATDPWEKQDQAATQAARVEALTRQLDAWWKP